jgi:hypothetical protein
MTDHELQKWRNDVIGRFINIEIMVDAIICQHYFKRIVQPFLFDVLRDQNFSFGLKRSILEKILGNKNTKEIQDLNQLNKIRNRFAHCGLEIFPIGKPGESFIHDPEHPGIPMDFKRHYEDFLEKAGDVEKYLFNLFKEKGGEVSLNP